jgi:protoporphyrin/coproporphyrin ferrochelatase
LWSGKKGVVKVGDKKVVLLVNLGTPAEPTVAAVKRYLREFLSDPLVLDMPALPRWLLLNLVILPFRSVKTTENYKKIWTESGSPLLIHSQDLANKLSEQLGAGYHVKLAMRYGAPSIRDAVQVLKEANCRDWVIVPLYPQYAKSTTESSWQAVCAVVSEEFAGLRAPNLHELKPFYDNTHYIAALKKVTETALAGFSADHVLMSYHGLPERHLAPPLCSDRQCDKQSGSCPVVSQRNRNCYRAQSYASSKALAQALGLSEDDYTVSFQSRLGRIPWIGPDTEAVLQRLYDHGTRRLAVVMPSFVVDCLETLEEIGMRLREQWEAMPETEFKLIPCLNADPAWVKSLGGMVNELLPVRVLASGVTDEA